MPYERFSTLMDISCPQLRQLFKGGDFSTATTAYNSDCHPSFIPPDGRRPWAPNTKSGRLTFQQLFLRQLTY